MILIKNLDILRDQSTSSTKQSNAAVSSSSTASWDGQNDNFYLLLNCIIFHFYYFCGLLVRITIIIAFYLLFL
jgi:hypothetical protein